MKKRILFLPILAGMVLSGCDFDLGPIHIHDSQQNQDSQGDNHEGDGDNHEEEQQAKVVSVTVSGAPSSVTDETAPFQLSADVVVENDASKEVTWKSSDQSVATVSESGLVTPKAAGSVTITATSKVDSSKSGSVTLAVTTVPRVVSVTIQNAPTKLTLLSKNVTLSANVVVKGTIANGVKWTSSDESVATINQQTGAVTIKGEGTVTFTATALADATKSDSVTVVIVDEGFAPEFLEDGYSYSKGFPVDVIKQFLGAGEYEIISPEKLPGGCYYVVYEADKTGPACVQVLLDGVVYEDYAYALMEAGFERVYQTSNYTIEAVDPSRKYTVSMYSDYDSETGEDIAPTILEFYKSEDVWDSSEISSDVAWDYAKIVNKDAEEIASAKDYLEHLPFVALGKDYTIEYVVDDSYREEIIEFLELFGTDVSTISEEELEYYLELFGYTGPECYLSISDYSLAEPFGNYEQVLLDAGYVKNVDDEGYVTYELASGLEAYVVSYGFTELGNTIYVEMGIATLEEFPVQAVNDYVANVVGSENSVIPFVGTEGALYRGSFVEGDLDIAVTATTLADVSAYAEAYELAGFTVEHYPADEIYPEMWVAQKGKLVVQFGFFEEGEEGSGVGQFEMLVYCDPTKHEEQGIYLPESLTALISDGEFELDPEIVKLDSPEFDVVSSNPDVATVDGLKVTPVAEGQTEITVSVKDSEFAATVVVNVLDKTHYDMAMAELNEFLSFCGVEEEFVLPLPAEGVIASSEDYFYDDFYGCYSILITTDFTAEAYYAQLEAAGFTLGEDEYGSFARLGDVVVCAFEYDEGVLETDVYFEPAEEEATGATIDFAEFTGLEGTFGAFSFETALGKGQSDPAYNDGKKELRLYAKNTITFTSEETITSIFFYANTCGETKATGTFVSASVGTVSAVEGGFLWEGEANEVTLTVSDSGQVHINAIEINGGGESGGGGGGQEELTSWPAAQIAACLEGGTEVVPPVATGTSFTFEESDEYYFDCYVNVYGGNMNAYLDLLESNNYVVQDYTAEYGCFSCLAPEGTLEIDVYDRGSYYELDIYACEPPAPELDEFPLSEVKAFLTQEGITTQSFPIPDGDSYYGYEDGYGGYEVDVMGGDCDAYISALIAAGYDVDDSLSEYGMYSCTKGDLQIDVMDYEEEGFSVTFGEIWSWEE